MLLSSHGPRQFVFGRYRGRLRMQPAEGSAMRPRGGPSGPGGGATS